MDKKVSFWHDIWLKDYPLIERVMLEKVNNINQEAKVSDFVDEKKHWKLGTLIGHLPRRL